MGGRGPHFSDGYDKSYYHQYAGQMAVDPTERGRDQGGITGRICASCLMGAKKFPREG